MKDYNLKPDYRIEITIPEKVEYDMTGRRLVIENLTLPDVSVLLTVLKDKMGENSLDIFQVQEAISPYEIKKRMNDLLVAKVSPPVYSTPKSKFLSFALKEQNRRKGPISEQK
jgi:hypothetical protein